jgi:hypothetical protein
VASSEFLRSVLVLKGGNALYFAYGRARSTVDLDFSARKTKPIADLDRFKTELDRILPPIASRLGVRLRVQKWKRNPPNLFMETPTCQFAIAYAFPGQKWFERWDHVKRPVPTVVNMEIAINEEVCEANKPFRQPEIQALEVCSVEDIFAEKLRALLQQVQRNRSRPQDVYDLTALLGGSRQPDAGKVAAFLKRKCEARQLVPSMAAFEDARVWERAARDYGALSRTVHEDLIEFGEAKTRIIEYVKRLDLPATGPLVTERGSSE